jgi:TPR repeat protein
MVRQRLLQLIALVLPIAAQTDPQQYLNSNYSRAAKALRSAEQGDAVSQYDFALICERGEGLPKNHREALKWLRLSANQGYAPAQLFMGFMYASGKGVAKDLTESRKWLQRAAEQGDRTAQIYLKGVSQACTTEEDKTECPPR